MPAAAKCHRLLLRDQVVVGLDRRLLRDRDDAGVVGGLADPRHLLEIEAHAAVPDQLVVDQPGVEGADGQAVRLRRVDRVGADQMAGAGHVAHHEGRARQMPLHVFGDQPAIGVVAAARRGGDDVGDGLAVEEVGAGLARGRRSGHRERGERAGQREQPRYPRHHDLPCLPRLPSVSPDGARQLPRVLAYRDAVPARTGSEARAGCRRTGATSSSAPAPSSATVSGGCLSAVTIALSTSSP